MPIQFGIDVLLASSEIDWKEQRIGMITNDAATTNTQLSSRLALQQHGFQLKKLFSPEHGILATGADGAPMLNGIDELTDLPVVSLYGEKLAPTEADLDNIDILLFDVPDVGVRFYTYLWTLSYLLEICATTQTPLIILDRPNPISGNLSLIEGPWSDANTHSFLGRWPMPIRHCSTLGELARYFNDTQAIHAPIEIIQCQGWHRTMFQGDWGLPFVPTSPAIQTPESLLLYPGLCFLEATNLSEGRSTDLSFEVVGAPWLKHSQIAQQINLFMDMDLEARAIHFIPSQNKYAGEQCKGIHFTVKAPDQFKPIFFGLLLIRLIKDLHPSEFEWAPYKTFVNPTGMQHLDKLLGVASAEALFELPMHQFIQQCTQITNTPFWHKNIQNYLLYLD